jgi:hypothetical protein
MAALPHAPTQALKSVLAEHLPWHGARLNFLAQFLLALLKVRSVSLAALAPGVGGTAKVDSHDPRRQRVFRSFAIDYDGLARLLARIGPVGDGPWRLTMDRTNWPFGKTDSNCLMLGIALPVFWSILDKAGNAATAERVALMERCLAVFGVAKSGALLADRECVGEEGCRWLQQQGIPFHPRLKRHTRVPNGGNRMMRLDDGDVLFVASSGAPPAEAIAADADRWPVATRFGCLNSRGCNGEDTHLTDPERLSKLMGLLVLADVWTYRTGERLHDGGRPIPLKKPTSAPSSPSSAMAATFCVISP